MSPPRPFDGDDRRGCTAGVHARLAAIHGQQVEAAVERGKIETRLGVLETGQASVEGKIDKLLAAHNVGRGVAITLTKLGLVLVAIAGGLAWLWDHLPKGGIFK